MPLLLTLVACAIVSACEPTPTPGAANLIESSEGTPITRSSPTPRQSLATTSPLQPSSSTPQPANPNATPGPTVASQATGLPTGAGGAAGSSATPSPTALLGATQTPLPTANLTLPPSLTPQSQTQATPTPTRTPTTSASSQDCVPATLLPVSGGWSVGKVCVHRADSDVWFVFGEVTNNTGSYPEYPEVTVTLLDANGLEFAEGYDFVYVEIMPAGATLPFAVMGVYCVVDCPNPPAQVQFTIAAPSTSSFPPRTDLALSNLQIGTNSGVTVLTGQVTNPGADLTLYAEITAGFYNQSGLVVGVAHDYLDIGALGASESLDFELFVDGLTDLIVSRSVFAFGY